MDKYPIPSTTLDNIFQVQSAGNNIANEIEKGTWYRYILYPISGVSSSIVFKAQSSVCSD